MRILAPCLAVALAFGGATVAAQAQDADNGRRVSERWCVECHAIESTAVKPGRTLSFAAIAAKQGITSEMIRSFLLMPHSTMPDTPLSRKDAQDIAAFIMGMKR